MDDKGGIQSSHEMSKTQRQRQAKDEAEHETAAYRTQRDADAKLSHGHFQDAADATQSTADLTAFVQNLLQQMQSRFQTMSDSIITKIDEMGNRIDDLEKSIGDLIKEVGVEPGTPQSKQDQSDSAKNSITNA